MNHCQIEVDQRKCEQEAIEPVQDTTVSGYHCRRVLHPGIPLHHRLHQVANLGSEADNQSNTQSLCKGRNPQNVRPHKGGTQRPGEAPHKSGTGLTGADLGERVPFSEESSHRVRGNIGYPDGQKNERGDWLAIRHFQVSHCKGKATQETNVERAQ